jgi:hypothetical protein
MIFDEQEKPKNLKDRKSAGPEKKNSKKKTEGGQNMGSE